MLLIVCPNCGPRNEVEFKCGGESHILRPLIDCSDEVWAEYVFFRHNPKGVTFERWCHTYGCARWFNVARDTCSHEIHGSYDIGEPCPDCLATAK
jgi:sarcosine oxidase, subunit delta